MVQLLGLGRSQRPRSSLSRPQDDEAVLVARVRCGEERACDTFVRRYGPAMLACARRFLRCDADSADAVQEAFVSAFRSIGSFTGISSLPTWLHRIVVNCCLMKLRGQKRRRTVSLDDLLPAFDEAGFHVHPVAAWREHPEEQLNRAEVRVQVRACIDRLPDAYRTIILLRDIEELDTDETAELLGVSRGVVKTRLHRAHQALRSLLEPLFLASEARDN
jgi:RNA polymerase sigma-70 factor, ECF subfamily